MRARQSESRGGSSPWLFGYSALLGLGLVASAPWWLARMATTQRYREGLGERLGRVPQRLRDVVAGRRVVWVHAVSVGEVLAVSRLVEELEVALNASAERAELPKWTAVVSTTTRTGQALARERFGAERVFYLPLDFAFAIRAYLRVLQPAMLVLAESELWPRMLAECGRAGVPVAVVNARVSDRSFRRALRVRTVWGRLLRKVSVFLAQSEEDARRLRALGARVESVQVSGNLKYDVRAPGGNRVAGLIEELAAGRPIVVAGSTCGGLKENDPDEEGWLITAWAGSVKGEFGALLVLAPRHPERFQQVWEDCIEFPSIKVSKLLASTGGTGGEVSTKPGDRPDIVLLDTIGDLAAVYQVAALAIVGGSLITRGGHNPLEPAQFGVPVLMGPSFDNFREIVAKMQAAHAISITVGEAQGPNERLEPNGLYRPEIYAMRDSLSAEMLRLLRDRQAAVAMGERGRQVCQREGGASARTVASLLPFLSPTLRAGTAEAVPA